MIFRPRPRLSLARLLLSGWAAVALLPTAAGSASQDPASRNPLPQTSPPQKPSPQASSPQVPTPRDPFEAYDAGAWEQALDGFVERRVERPGEAATALNLGSALYQLQRYEEAAREFEAAAASGQAEVKRKALYNLGNTAFRQGRWPRAEELYRRVLELDPGDADAKHNLELVLRLMDEHRRESRRRSRLEEEPAAGREASPPDQTGRSPERSAPSAGSPAPATEPKANRPETEAMTVQEALRYLEAIQEAAPSRVRQPGELRGAPAPESGKDW